MTKHRGSRVTRVLAVSLTLIALAGCSLFEDLLGEDEGGGGRTRTGNVLDIANETLDRTNVDRPDFIDSDLRTLIDDREVFDEFALTQVRIEEDTNTITVTLKGLTGNMALTDDTDLDGTPANPSDIDDNEGVEDITAGVNGEATLEFRLQNDVPPGSPFSPSSTPNVPEWTRLVNFNDLYYRNRARRFAPLLDDAQNPNENPLLHREDNLLTTDRIEPSANYVEYHAVSYVGDIPGAGRSRQEIVRVEVILIPNYDDGVAPRIVNNEDVNANALEGDHIGLRLSYSAAAVRTPTDSEDVLPEGEVTYEGLYMGHNRVTLQPTEAIPFTEFTFDPAQPVIAKEANAPRMTVNVDFAATPRTFDFVLQDAQLRINQRINQRIIDTTRIRRYLVTGRGGMNISGSGVFDEDFKLTSIVVTEETDDQGDVTETTEYLGVNQLDNFNLSFQIADEAGNIETVSFPSRPLTVGLDANDDLTVTRSGNFVHNHVQGFLFDRGERAAVALAGFLELRSTGDLQTPIGGTTTRFTITHEMLGVFIADRQ